MGILQAVCVCVFFILSRLFIVRIMNDARRLIFILVLIYALQTCVSISCIKTLLVINHQCLVKYKSVCAEIYLASEVCYIGCVAASASILYALLCVALTFKYPVYLFAPFPCH